MKTLLLDMDGVLCDFVTAACNACGITPDWDNWPTNEWDIAKMMGLTARAMWDNIDQQGPEFWANLEPYPWADELVDELRHFCSMYDFQLTIATAPGWSHNSYAGKRQWLIKHGLGKVPSMFGSEKHLLAHRNRILIDDGPHNIAKFRLYCGTAITFPMHWNSLHSIKTDKVKHVLGELEYADKLIRGNR